MSEQVPYPLRVAVGVGLAALGALLIWGIYRRATRPTQADVVRRVAKAAQSNAAHASDRPPDEPDENDAPDKQVDGARSGGAARSSRPLRSLTPQAFLMADQYTQGRDPWAVPLRHDVVRIGRHQENDIRLEDKTVHRYHALLHRSPDGVFLIRDLSGDTGNGVYVNGSRIEQTALRPGDLVELGAVRLRFQQQLPS